MTALHFRHCDMERASVNAILASLTVKQTVEELSMEWVNYFHPRDETLEQAFMSPGILQINKTLVKLDVSKLDLRGGRMSALLRENYTLKTLCLDDASIDNEALIPLGTALESPNVVMEDIGLPNDTGRLQVGNVQEGTRAFLRSLARMRTIHTVRFFATTTDADEDMRRLLLVAVRENKNLFHLHQYLSGYWEHHRGPFVSKIEYYLKLNRFGRRVLDAPKIIHGLWPRILSPMTEKPEDADALFFFVREYFSRQSARVYRSSQEQQQQQQQPEHPQQPQQAQQLQLRHEEGPELPKLQCFEPSVLRLFFFSSAHHWRIPLHTI
jgi:hypothetical protein